MSTENEYEYCIIHPLYPDEPHRGPWTLAECQEWIDEWETDGGRVGMFYIATRTKTPWEKLDDNMQAMR